MSKIRRLLFPFRQTFRRLELEKLWWHRLAVVLLFVALILTFLFSWVLGNDADAPVQTIAHEIQYWAILPPPPGSDIFDQVAGATTPPPDAHSFGKGMVAMPLASVPLSKDGSIHVADMLKTIELPDGKTATYPGTTSDEAIKIEWKHKLNMAEAQAALLGLGIAVLMTLICSYLLQASYRVLLYVIYGAKPAEP